MRSYEVLLSEILKKSEKPGLILSVPYLGYVVIGLLAFVLGILVTMLCLHIKDLRGMDAEKKND